MASKNLELTLWGRQKPMWLPQEDMCELRLAKQELTRCRTRGQEDCPRQGV